MSRTRSTSFRSSPTSSPCWRVRTCSNPLPGALACELLYHADDRLYDSRHCRLDFLRYSPPGTVGTPELGRKYPVPDLVVMLVPPARRKQVRIGSDRTKAEVDEARIDVEDDVLHLVPRWKKCVDLVELDAVTTAAMFRG